MMLDIYKREEGGYPVFLEFQRSAIPVDPYLLYDGVINSIMYLVLLNPIVYSSIYFPFLYTNDIFDNVDYLKGWMILQGFLWKSCYNHTLYFSA